MCLRACIVRTAWAKGPQQAVNAWLPDAGKPMSDDMDIKAKDQCDHNISMLQDDNTAAVRRYICTATLACCGTSHPMHGSTRMKPVWHE